VVLAGAQAWLAEDHDAAPARSHGLADSNDVNTSAQGRQAVARLQYADRISAQACRSSGRSTVSLTAWYLVRFVVGVLELLLEVMQQLA